MGLRGSLTRHLPVDTRYASTFPVYPAVSPPEQERQVAGDMLTDGVGKKQEEKTMEKPIREGKELTREQHMALVEFLDQCSTKTNEAFMREYMRDITGIREFKFLEEYFPPYDNDFWDVYREELQEAHRWELHSYTERFPDELYHEAVSLPRLLEEGDSVTRTPLDFLASCGSIEDSVMYREVYGDNAPFPQGSVRAISPQRIALFHEGAALPLLLMDNTPANWANLYTQANNSGINVNGIIPSPEEVENLGTAMLRASEDRLRNAMSREWQEGEFRKDCALAQSMAAETGEKYLSRSEEGQKKFAQFPYIPGVEVPPFALEEEGKLTPYSGFTFDKMGEDGKSVILRKWEIGQLEERITVSNTLYAEMIENAKRAANREEPQRETVTRFEKMIEKDVDERRSNTAVNFWHNYKILCRQQASNPQEAMEMARSIVRQMPQREQAKLRRSIKAYEKATKPLMSNPLLKPFVKPITSGFLPFVKKMFGTSRSRTGPRMALSP
jgi:hypothetical protein